MNDSYWAITTSNYNKLVSAMIIAQLEFFPLSKTFEWLMDEQEALKIHPKPC